MTTLAIAKYKICSYELNGVITPVRQRFQSVPLEDADVVVVPHDIIRLGLKFAVEAKKRNIPVVVIQHGRGATVDYCPPVNCKLLADRICVWGPEDVERLLSAGISPDKIVLTGTTVFDSLRPREKHEGNVVLFAPAHWAVHISHNAKLRDALRKISNIKVITKTIWKRTRKSYDNPIYSHPVMNTHLGICAEALSQADVVVTGREGTFVLMAQALDIPVVCVRGASPPKKYATVQKFTPACDLVDIDELESAIFRNLENPDKLKTERKQVAYNEGGVGLEGNPLDKIIGTIEDVVKLRNSQS